mgnify:CR=1 FL=1|jgi:hypothetical protein
MWVRLTDKTITNMSHVVHVSLDDAGVASHGKTRYYVRLYGSGGKCFEATSFETRQEAKDMFDKLITFCTGTNQGMQTDLFL